MYAHIGMIKSMQIRLVGNFINKDEGQLFSKGIAARIKLIC